MYFLDTNHPHVVPRSNVILGCIPLWHNQNLSAFYNGERIIYVKGAFHPVLPTSATISGHACKIWHTNQKKIKCNAYDASSTNELFCDKNNPLSNFYRCNINIYERDWLSSEHPYQWMKMIKNRFDKEAQEIQEALHAAAANVISNRIPSEQLKNWGDDKKLSIMNFILRAKVNQCHELKRALTAGGKKLLRGNT